VLFSRAASASIVREMSAIGESDSVANLRELVSHPHVVEILDALSHGPMTFARIRTHVHAGRRALVVALRLVAARGLVTKNDNGSWDSDAPLMSSTDTLTSAGGSWIRCPALRCGRTSLLEAVAHPGLGE